MIIGRGWIGRKLAALTGWPLISHDAAIAAIAGLKPEIVVNCAGMTGSPNVDACERAKAETIAANSVFPVALYYACEKVGAKFAHFSTGCLYQGDANFSEDDAPNYEGSIYSAAKSASDAFLKDKAWVFRIRMPFDATYSPRSLLTKLENYAIHGKLIDGLNSISDADEMCEIAKTLIDKRAPFGAYHLVNTYPITTRQIASIMGLTAQWMEWDEFHQRGNGARSVCTLSNDKLQDYCDVRDVFRALDIAMRERKLSHAA